MGVSIPVDGTAVALILHALDERETKAVAQTVALLDELGEATCLSLLGRARELHREGAMLTHDGRPRTLGGVFFALARERLTQDARREIFNILPRRIQSGDLSWTPGANRARAASVVETVPNAEVSDAPSDKGAEVAGSSEPAPVPVREVAPTAQAGELDELDRLIEAHLRARLPALIEGLVEALVPQLRAEAKKLIVGAVGEGE